MGRHVVAGLDPDYHVTVADRVDGGSHQPHGPVDVLDIEALDRAVRGEDAIIHIAALDAAVPAGPHEFFHTNTLAAWNTLHAGYEAGCALQAHEIQSSEMATLIKLSQQSGTESCVVCGDAGCEA